MTGLQLLILVFFLIGSIYCSLSSHLIALKIFIIGSYLINEASVRQNLYDSVSCCLHNLMIPAGEELYTRELNHTFIECGNRFHIQVVGRLIEYQAVGTGYHHLG